MNMNVLILFGLMVSAVENLQYEDQYEQEDLSVDLSSEYYTFMSAFDKTYSEDELAGRKDCYNETRYMISQHNKKAMAGVYSYKLGINQFADMATTEVAVLYTGYEGNYHKRLGSTYKAMDLECQEEVDWRNLTGVSPVKNQGRCGSCWAFATTGALEYLLSITQDKLENLSEQELVDCSGSYNNHGCSGGLMTKAMNYTRDKQSIATQTSYPYTAKEGKCQCNNTDRVYIPLKGCVNIEKGCEKALKEALAFKGTVSVAMDASPRTFQLYSSGVYNDPTCSCTNLNHGVLAIGYGTSDDGEDYWLIKNSWGTSWGEKGYAKISRTGNICGITTLATYCYI